MSFFQTCTVEQLQALKAAQEFTGVKLKDANPMSAQFESTSGGQAVQMFLQEKFPLQAAQFRGSSEDFSLSLDAVLYNKGVGELTNKVHAELYSGDEIYRKQFDANQENEEKRLLALMQSEADKAFEVRTGRPADERDRPNFALHGQMASAAEAQWIHRKLMAD